MARGDVERVRAEVERALAAAGVARADAVVVACSHGPDSLALADVALELAGRGRLAGVTLVYVDHGQRAGAAGEGEAVRRLAAARGAHARVVRVRVDRARGRGLEEAMRAARYAALDEVAAEVGARWILTGHTATDQAETVVGRLVRGAGLAGLAGIPAVRGRIVRPLLGIERPTLVRYLAARRLTPSHDETNDDPRFTRNRLRHRVLPALREENPSVDAALARAAAALREASDALDHAARAALARLDARAEDRRTRLSAGAVAALPAGLAKRVVQMVAERLGASLEATHLDAVVALCAAPAGRVRTLTLPGLVAARERGELLLETPGLRPLRPRRRRP